MIIPNLQIKLLLTFPPLLTSLFDSFSSFVSNSTLLSSFLQMVLISLRSCSAKFNQLLYFQSHQLRLSHPISKERLPLRDYCFVWVRSIMFNWLDEKIPFIYLIDELHFNILLAMKQILSYIFEMLPVSFNMVLWIRNVRR